MYLIIEGMPSSGKTTLAKALAKEMHGAYYKSLLPNDDFGNRIRTLRDSGENEAEVDLLHIVDLYRNELTIGKLLKMGQPVIRDKCFLSSVAHFMSVQSKIEQEMKETIRMAYEQLASLMIIPDAVVLLDRSLDDSLRLSGNKVDKTAIDEMILRNEDRFRTQAAHLRNSARKYFTGRLLEMNWSMTLEEEINWITEKGGRS